MIVSALIALAALDSAKTGKPGVLALTVSTVAVFAQSAVAATTGVLRSALDGVADLPRLGSQNAELRARNRALAAQNARLSEALARAPEATAIARELQRVPNGIAATVVGYDPENISRLVTIDRGSNAGIAIDDGVLGEDGVVGRVVAVTPLASSVLLVSDGASKVPAVVQRGRWWGIATGTNGRIRLEYVSQDAKLKVGDAVVTGKGRSFAAGLPLGTISHVDHPEGGLYQTATLEPAVAFGRISAVIVVPSGVRPDPATTDADRL